MTITTQNSVSGTDGTPARIALMPAVAATVPAAAAVVLLAIFVTAEAAGLRPFASPPDANVAEAVAWGDAGQALAFIASGQDPNARWTIRQHVLDSHGDLHVTAVQAAVLSRRAELVELMFRHGARPDNPRGLACLAQAVGAAASLPPSVFGVADGEYYRGPSTGDMEAVALCGLPAD
jgi:hypothetical protein